MVKSVGHVCDGPKANDTSTAMTPVVTISLLACFIVLLPLSQMILCQEDARLSLALG